MIFVLSYIESTIRSYSSLPIGEIMSAGYITFLGHASFKLETSNGSIVLIDPWLRENPLCPPELKTQSAADLILVTHGHGDHLDADLPNLLEQTGAAVVAQAQVRTFLMQKEVKTVEPMNTGGSMEVRGFRVTMTAAFHSAHINLSENSTGFSHEAVGFVLQTPDGLRV